MLPKNTETARGLYLQELVQKASHDDLMAWPEPSTADYTAIGKLVVMYNYVDFNFRRMVEDFDDAGRLTPPWKGRSKKLKTFELDQAVRAMLNWPSEVLHALDRVIEMRRLRNLVGHFAVRRFPNDDAFLFIGKSTSDFKQVFGAEPDSGLMMTAVLDAPALFGILDEVRHVQIWIGQAASDLAIDLQKKNLINRS